MRDWEVWERDTDTYFNPHLIRDVFEGSEGGGSHPGLSGAPGGRGGPLVPLHQAGGPFTCNGTSVVSNSHLVMAPPCSVARADLGVTTSHVIQSHEYFLICLFQQFKNLVKNVLGLVRSLYILSKDQVFNLDLKRGLSRLCQVMLAEIRSMSVPSRIKQFFWNLEIRSHWGCVSLCDD